MGPSLLLLFSNSMGRVLLCAMLLLLLCAMLMLLMQPCHLVWLYAVDKRDAASSTCSLSSPPA